MKCGGYIRASDDPTDVQVKPCPDPATWIYVATGTGFCDAHKRSGEVLTALIGDNRLERYERIPPDQP